MARAGPRRAFGRAAASSAARSRSQLEGVGEQAHGLQARRLDARLAPDR